MNAFGKGGKDAPSIGASRGFSLVAVSLLMVLLTAMAVGLLSLSAVSLRGAGTGSAIAEARANARLALYLGLGELQRLAGPDGRVTVPADQVLYPGHPHGGWVGVFDAWAAERGVLRRPEPVFGGWLVGAPDPTAAGQRGYAADEDAATGVRIVGANGRDDTWIEEVRVPRIRLAGGELGWWTGDESMKAHVTAGSEPGDVAAGVRELTSATAATAANGAVLADLGLMRLDDPRRGSFVTTGQLDFQSATAGRLFHDVTTVSRGLAVDVTRGRFKYDYSIFANGPRRQAEHLALYKADGAINQFQLASGRLLNSSPFRAAGVNPLSAFGNATGQPGINLEELWIHSNVYRTLRWESGSPQLWLMNGSERPSLTDFRHRALADPWFSYMKPVFASVQFVFSFVSRPDPAAAGRFRMLLQMDALVKVWNPNNVKVVIPPGSSFAVQLLSLPFKVQWSITAGSGAAVNRPQSGLGGNTYSLARGNWPSSQNRYGQAAFQWLRGNVGGLAARGTSAGYTLEPGESKVFGHDRDVSNAIWGSDPNVNLSPGWGPGRQALLVADFGATNLGADDMIEFVVTPDNDAEPRAGSRTYCNQWIGHRAAGAASQGGNGGLALGGSNLPTAISFGSPDPAYFPTIRSSQRLRVSQYGTPKPFMIFGHYLNVEQAAPGTRDAFASAARMLTNAAITTRRFRSLEADQMTAFQQFWRADPLPLAYDSPLIDINSRDQGRFGGGHQVLHGVTRCATRQIDPLPPMSLMSLSHAIANGFADRFGEAAGRSGMNLDVLQSDGLNGAFRFQPTDIAFSTVTHAAPQGERAIGNSFATPFLRPDAAVGSGMFHSARATAVPVFDHSYLANAALFDAWFCSSVHDGRLIPKGAPYQDPRSQAQVLADFFDRGTGDSGSRLLNTRVVPASSAARARERLLNGGELHGEAIARLGAHLFLEGTFNVNSTRKEAWKAVLASARDEARRHHGGSVVTAAGRTPVGSSGLVAAGMAQPLASPLEIEQWSGFRALSDEQIDDLAGRVIDEVRSRGPFLSMADFLNRRLAGRGDQQLLGAVQAAIEAAGLNAPLKTGSRGLGAADFRGLPGAAVAGAGGGMSRSAGIPGYVMQSDVLGPLANQMAPRGDSFRLRGYGASRDASGRVLAEARCEAVVQRVAGWMDDRDAAETPRADLAHDLNRRFGRRFEVVSFRWLGRDEI